MRHVVGDDARRQLMLHVGADVRNQTSLDEILCIEHKGERLTKR